MASRISITVTLSQTFILFYFLIGKLHTHLVGLEPMTSLSITLLREEEEPVELYSSLALSWTSIKGSSRWKSLNIQTMIQNSRFHTSRHPVHRLWFHTVKARIERHIANNLPPQSVHVGKHSNNNSNVKVCILPLTWSHIKHLRLYVLHKDLLQIYVLL